VFKREDIIERRISQEIKRIEGGSVLYGDHEATYNPETHV